MADTPFSTAEETMSCTSLRGFNPSSPPGTELTDEVLSSLEVDGVSQIFTLFKNVADLSLIHIYRPCPFQRDRQGDDGGQNQAYAS